MNNSIIGGEYAIELESIKTNPLDEGPKPLFSCGRMAFKAILQHAFDNTDKTVLLPDYICGSMPEAVIGMGMKCDFYHINMDFTPSLNSIFKKIQMVDAIVLVNYFGMISSALINSLVLDVKSNIDDIVVIVDDVQNYYGLELEKTCDYAFTSYRKWFPVPDGAKAVWVDRSGNHAELLPESGESEEALFSKYKFAGNVLKNYRDIIGDQICLEMLEKGEKLVSTEEQAYAMRWTTGAINKLDYSSFEKKRKKNARILHEGLSRLGITHLYLEKACPLFVPILIENNRDLLRKAMFEKNIFCPVHWDSQWTENFGELPRNNLFMRELSLICDHRYGEEEMNRQLELLENECFHY